MMNNDQSKIYEKLKDNEFYFKTFLKIKDKNSRLIPFEMNEPQRKLDAAIKSQQDAGKPVRVVILKARQMGFSTYTEGRLFKETVTHKYVKTGIITHKDTATANLFKMSKTFYNNMGDFKPQILSSNAKELIFDTKDGKGLGSSIKCMTAGASGVGRSDTFNLIHCSEFAFWEGDKLDTLRGLLQSVPDTKESMVIIESTANGFEEFKDIWDNAVKGKNDYIPVFFAWFELKEYRKPYYNFKLTDEEEELKQRYNLDNEQIAWRRYCIANKCNGDIEYFNQEYPDCPENAFISTGSSVFDKEKVVNRINAIRDILPIKQGNFAYKYDNVSIDDVEFINDKKGCIKIYIDVVEGHPYVIGGDTAGEGSDYFTAQVIDNTTGNQVATLRMQTDEDLYSHEIYCLGMYYNQALIGLEVNFSTFPTKELQRLEYPNLYIRQQEDTFTGRVLKSYGFRTTTKTRPFILAELIRIVREDIISFNDYETLLEMITFVRNRDNGGKMEAMNGYHDDLIMAMAITYYIRSQQDFVVDTNKHTESNKFVTFRDIFEDNNEESEGFLEW